MTNRVNTRVRTLDLSNQGLNVLPDLSIYPNLKTLYCYCNNLTSLGNLPESITYLDCNSNKKKFKVLKNIYQMI